MAHTSEFLLYEPHAARSSATRKGQPIATGVLAYFPKAMAAIAEHSKRGNDKHNPGEPLHWAREKSTDEADSAVRHITDALADGPLALDADGGPHLVGAAWRVLAWLERALEGDERWRTVAPAAPRVVPGHEHTPDIDAAQFTAQEIVRVVQDALAAIKPPYIVTEVTTRTVDGMPPGVVRVVLESR